MIITKKLISCVTLLHDTKCNKSIKNNTLSKLILHHKENIFAEYHVAQVSFNVILINYRESQMAIGFQYIQQNFAQEIKQNGNRGQLHSTVTKIVVMHVYQTNTSRGYWSFVTHSRLYQSRKVMQHDILQIHKKARNSYLRKITRSFPLAF